MLRVQWSRPSKIGSLELEGSGYGVIAGFLPAEGSRPDKVIVADDKSGCLMKLNFRDVTYLRRGKG